MKPGSLALFSAFVILFFGSGACIGQTAASNTSASSSAALTPRELSAQLSTIDKQLKDKPSKDQYSDLQRALPSDWQIQTPERTYSVSTQPLRRLLNPEQLDDARAYIATLRSQLGEGTTRGDDATQDVTNARADLDKILAEPRFHQVHKPSAWDLLRQRISAWLERKIRKLLDAASRHPLGAKIVFWVMVVAGVALLAFLAYRLLTQGDRVNSLHPEPVRMRTRSWQEWIRAARESAARGDYREAIHSAYWAGITRLQDAGALPLDRAKTPREYLRALSAPRAPEQESNEKYKVPLGKLTTNLELAWYANRKADSAEFSDTLQQVEALGCRLD
jgi:Domain of unknown function (DUF4129)